jgi:hypothetical protein
MSSKLGILWKDPALWVVGKNCHLETIVCPDCGSIETATVLHTHPEFCRMHQCDVCKKYIGQFRWRLVAQPLDAPGEVADTPAPSIEGEGSAVAGGQLAAPPLDGKPTPPYRPAVGVQSSLF